MCDRIRAHVGDYFFQKQHETDPRTFMAIVAPYLSYLAPHGLSGTTFFVSSQTKSLNNFSESCLKELILKYYEHIK